MTITQISHLYRGQIDILDSCAYVYVCYSFWFLQSACVKPDVPTPYPCAGNKHVLTLNFVFMHISHPFAPLPILVQGTCTFFLLIFFNAHQSSIHPTPHLVQGTCTFLLLICLTSCLPQDVLVRSRFVCKKLPQGVHLRPRHSKGYPSHINIAENPNSNQSESLIY